MPRNGSGSYSLPAGNPVVTGTTINSTVHNNTMADIATALTNSLSKDGQTVPTADIPMGGHKITGLEAGSDPTDAAQYGQIPPVVVSISALRALDKTVYAKAFVTGYYAAGDGGGGAYYYDSSDTTSSDNGGTIIVANDNGRWKLIYSYAVDAEQFGAKGDGVTDDKTPIQNALNSGVKIVRLNKGKSYRLVTGLSVPAGVSLIGDGKANSSLVCAADITAITFLSVNDAAISGFLISAYATQTDPLILLDAASATMARCRVRDVQGSGSSTDFPFISVRTRNGAYGSWAHEFHDLSVSGCGTIIKCETQFANSWINSINASHIHANDFIRGMHLIATAGDGCSDSTFLDWATQTSARTEFGALISDVSAQGINRKNSFHDVRFYDLPAASRLYYIGDNVSDTNISGLLVDDFTPARVLDKGVNTRINGGSLFDYLARTQGRDIQVPTNAGLSASTSGTATTSAATTYGLLRTGATAGSVARLYSTDIVTGLSQNQLFNVDFGKPLKFSFLLTRITSGASALGRVQFKTTQADGQLAAKGIGVQIDNYALTGESYGTALVTVSLGTTMNDAETYKIDIVHYPAQRIEWWVNGVLKAQQSTANAIPGSTGTCYFHSSLDNVTAVDVQMMVNGIEVRSGD